MKDRVLLVDKLLTDRAKIIQESDILSSTLKYISLFDTKSKKSITKLQLTMELTGHAFEVQIYNIPGFGLSTFVT